MVDAHMARLAASGLMPVGGAGATAMAPAFAWQVIRGAAVSSPKVCDGAQSACLVRLLPFQVVCTTESNSHLTGTTDGAQYTHRPSAGSDEGGCVQDCRGHAPNYGEGARETLRGTLHAMRHLFHEALGPLLDSRTGTDLLPLLLQGKALSRHCLDFSGVHSAVLWLGPSIAAAGAAVLQMQSTAVQLN